MGQRSADADRPAAGSAAAEPVRPPRKYEVRGWAGWFWRNGDDRSWELLGTREIVCRIAGGSLLDESGLNRGGQMGTVGDLG